MAERIVRVGLVWCEHKHRGRDTRGLRVQVIGQLSGLHSVPTSVQRGALRARLYHVPRTVFSETSLATLRRKLGKEAFFHAFLILALAGGKCLPASDFVCLTSRKSASLPMLDM